MEKAPKSMRLQIGLFGRTNVGKSSFLNMVTGQNVAITSAMPGTTTDIVEKSMELLPIGPVVFLDTGGIDDTSQLSTERIKKTENIFHRADIILLITEPDVWTDFEDHICRKAQENNTPVIVVINKIDMKIPSQKFLDMMRKKFANIVLCSSCDADNRDNYVNGLKKEIIQVCPEDFIKPPTIIGDLIPQGGLAILIVPIDYEAPKGRIILPQVQIIRDALDNHAATITVKETEYLAVLDKLKTPPDLVICDSQVVDRMVAETPPGVPCTTFSIVFARYKSDLIGLARGAAVIDQLTPVDKILVVETCSHHAIEGDIGREKIPRWLKEYVGGEIRQDVSTGRDFPQDLSPYKMILQCGSCMLTRREALYRFEQAEQAGVAITNYGICISVLRGVLERVLSPFPMALEAYRAAKATRREEVCYE